MSIIPKIVKGAIGGAAIKAALGRFAPPEQPSGFNLPAFNTPARNPGARNVVSPWPVRSRLGWPAGSDLGTLPSAIMSRSGPTKSWLAQTYGPQSDQPDSGFSVSVGGNGVADVYHPSRLDPEMATIDRGSLERARVRKDLGFGLMTAFRDRNLGRTPSAFVEQRLPGGRLGQGVRSAACAALERFGL